MLTWRNTIKLIALAVAVGALAGCTTIMVKPGSSQYDFAADKSTCEYEALKYGHVDIRSGGGIGAGFSAGIEEGLRRNEITKACLEQKGWRAQ